MRISGGHPCLWTLCWCGALSFGEGVGGKSSAGRSFTTSNGVYILWCTFIDFHIGANFFLDRTPLNCDRKKKSVESSCCPFHFLRLLQLPIVVEQTTLEPTPIWYTPPLRDLSKQTHCPYGYNICLQGLHGIDVITPLDIYRCYVQDLDWWIC